jgi:hypothetical protein
MKECPHTGLLAGKIGKEGRGREFLVKGKVCCGGNGEKMHTGVAPHTLFPLRKAPVSHYNHTSLEPF